MSLDWNLGKIKNWKKLCHIPLLHEDGSPKRDDDGDALVRINVVTEALIHVTMSLDLGRITEENLDEWLWRLAYREAIGHGEFLVMPTGKKGAFKERNFTREEVEAHIGLSTNVSTLSRKEWLAKVTKWMSREADAIVRTKFAKETP